MVLPIGGFMPIPLAMMIPFMATQSMVMGDAFGRAFQYGKRKISAMSNEEFNKTSLEQQASEMFAAYKIIIGDTHLQNAIAESSELQRMIIKEMLAIIPQMTKDFATGLAEDVGTVAGEATEILDSAAHLLGQHVGHDTTTAITTKPKVQLTQQQQDLISLNVKQSNVNEALVLVQRFKGNSIYQNAWLRRIQERDALLKKYASNHGTPKFIVGNGTNSYFTK